MVQNNYITLDESRGSHTAKKFDCPACHKKKRFVKYYNHDTNEYLPDEFGRCDRQEACGYFVQPWDKIKEILPTATNSKPKYNPQPQPTEKPIKQVPRSTVAATLTHYDYNNFFTWLSSIVGVQHAIQAAKKYFIGTAKNNGTIFWQIDRFMRIRTGQRIIYKSDGHRDKEQPPKRLFTLADGYDTCLFGEHLLYLEPNTKTIGIVESEKTAVICSIYLPIINGKPVTWLASGGANGLTETKIKALAGKEVILCPDFSYHARATWGALPMHKAANEKGILIPNPNGKPDTDFIPYSKKIQNIGAIVKFFDPYPHIADSSDIADYLIKMLPPIFYEKPDFNSFVVSDKPDNQDNTAKRDILHPTRQQKATEIENHITGVLPFRLIKDEQNNVIDIMISPDSMSDKVLEYLSHPMLTELIKELSIFEGEIMPNYYELYNT